MKVLVMGGGPGGYVAAIRAAQLGASVTLVERERVGGTCLNVGCIPTKALLHAAEVYEETKKASAFGVMAEVKIDFEKMQAHKKTVVEQLTAGVSGLLRANKIRVVQAEAAFIDKNTVRAGDERISFDRCIIATGSVPAKPPVPGMDLPQCIDSTGALALEAIPAELAIVGGGVIGVEMATIYATLGAKVTIIEMQPDILPTMDREMTKIVRKGLQQKGVAIMTDAKVLAVETKGDIASVRVACQGQARTVEAQKVLVSTGRRANTEALNLAAVGIRHNRGCILVDSRQQTNVPGIYAVGDCTGGVMLAHTASMQGEVAAENAMGHDAVYDGKTNPDCVYTNPELAGVGLTEEMAKERGIAYRVGRFPLTANGKSLIMNGGNGLVKIIAGRQYGEILGVHIAGPRATDLIAEGALAIGMEATLDELIATIHAHPTVAEAMREAALAAYNRAIHIPN